MRKYNKQQVKILSLQHTISYKSYKHIIPKVERYRRTEREKYKAEIGEGSISNSLWKFFFSLSPFSLFSCYPSLKSFACQAQYLLTMHN